MTDTYDEPKTFVVPNEEDTTAWSIINTINQAHEAYWFVLCPERECGKIHPRIVTKYWQKEPREEGGFQPHATEQHCFYCDVTGRHFKINPYPPFNITGEIPMPVLKAFETERDDEETKSSFE